MLGSRGRGLLVRYDGSARFKSVCVLGADFSTSSLAESEHSLFRFRFRHLVTRSLANRHIFSGHPVSQIYVLIPADTIKAG